MDQEKIGLFIAECRKKKGLTQLQLADLLGVTDKAVSKWENGRCLPDLSLIENLCKNLDISVNELLSGQELSKQNYQNELERNILLMINNVDKKFSKKYKKVITLFVSITLIIILYFCAWTIDEKRLNNFKPTLFHTFSHNISESENKLFDKEMEMIEEYLYKVDKPNYIKFLSYSDSVGGPNENYKDIRYISVYEEIYERKNNKLYFVDNNYLMYKTTFYYKNKDYNLSVIIPNIENADNGIYAGNLKKQHEYGDISKILQDDALHDLENYANKNKLQVYFKM